MMHIHVSIVGVVLLCFVSIADARHEPGQQRIQGTICTGETEPDEVDETEALLLLLRPIAREAAAHCMAGPVFLHILPEHSPMLLHEVFAEALMNRGLEVRTTAGGEQSQLTIDVREMSMSAVSGENSSYFRKTVVTLGILAEERSGKVTFAGERTAERGDSLSGEAPFTYRSYLDDRRSWWETLLEPALVTATAIVIVILLFTVRGSS